MPFLRRLSVRAPLYSFFLLFTIYIPLATMAIPVIIEESPKSPTPAIDTLSFKLTSEGKFDIRFALGEYRFPLPPLPRFLTCFSHAPSCESSILRACLLLSFLGKMLSIRVLPVRAHKL